MFLGLDVLVSQVTIVKIYFAFSTLGLWLLLTIAIVVGLELQIAKSP